MNLSQSNSIAYDPPTYVETLAKRVRWARRHLHLLQSQRILAEARDYLLHRRIPVNLSNLPPEP